jgi:hypothetical protein
LQHPAYILNQRKKLAEISIFFTFG